MLFCYEIGCSSVYFKGDALLVIQAVNHQEICETWIGTEIENAKNFLKYRLFWTLNFIYREGNGAAHALAHLGLNHWNERVWIEDFPLEISPIVLTEFAQ